MSKIIRDLVHGYIDISPFEEEIINTLNFQRLKDVKQLTAQHVYPSATHNRFEHSLGVMYLSRKAFRHLKRHLLSIYDIKEEHFEFLLLHLTIASLLHDVGHAPFSHLGEKYYRVSEITTRIKETIHRRGLEVDPNIFSAGYGSPHELMSCFVILEKYADIILKHNDKIELELICRCIIGNKYIGQEKWLENIVIELLNSKTIDTDKLDYLMRDAYMTGISVSPIDTTRLFKNIYINPKTKNLTFWNKALPVIQNIVDSRDALYLWVCNHHTAVYTDFIIEFYIKHLIVNHEKNQFEDRLNPSEYFSCDAICHGLVSDSHLIAKLKSPLHLLSSEKVSSYTKLIFPQLFERSFLKPLWKTIYEYRTFLISCVKDHGLITDLAKKMCDDDYIYRGYIAKQIIAKCGLKHGELFVVPRSNKFYSLNSKNVFKVHIEDYDQDISALLPQKNFGELYDNVAFYVFGHEDKLDEIKKCFIEVVTTSIPDKVELPDDTVKLNWFTDDI